MLDLRHCFKEDPNHKGKIPPAAKQLRDKLNKSHECSKCNTPGSVATNIFGQEASARIVRLQFSSGNATKPVLLPPDRGSDAEYDLCPYKETIDDPAVGGGIPFDYIWYTEEGDPWYPRAKEAGCMLLHADTAFDDGGMVELSNEEAVAGQMNGNAQFDQQYWCVMCEVKSDVSASPKPRK